MEILKHFIRAVIIFLSVKNFSDTEDDKVLWITLVAVILLYILDLISGYLFGTHYQDQYSDNFVGFTPYHGKYMEADVKANRYSVLTDKKYKLENIINDLNNRLTSTNCSDNSDQTVVNLNKQKCVATEELKKVQQNLNVISSRLYGPYGGYGSWGYRGW